jgi:hypothetical protein
MEIKIRRNWEFESAHYEGVKIKLRYLTTSELDDCWIIEKSKEKPTFDVDMKKMVTLAVEKIDLKRNQRQPFFVDFSVKFFDFSPVKQEFSDP